MIIYTLMNQPVARFTTDQGLRPNHVWYTLFINKNFLDACNHGKLEKESYAILAKIEEPPSQPPSRQLSGPPQQQTSLVRQAPQKIQVRTQVFSILSKVTSSFTEETLESYLDGPDQENRIQVFRALHAEI